MKSVMLVTGGAGFIGSNFIKYILEVHPELIVLNFDNLTYAGRQENLDDLESEKKKGRYRFVLGDISKRRQVMDAMSAYGKVEFIVNFAAESHVDRSIQASKQFVQTNIVGTSILLDAAKEMKVSKYVQVSTDEVYGSAGNNYKFTERTRLQPNSPYSASKASADLMVRAYFKTHKLPVVITRCSNNYGPNQYPEKLIPLMITNILEGKKLPVYGTGQNVRDWIHVTDHCRAIETALFYGKEGEIYNVGGGNEISNIDLVKRILKLMQADESLIEFVEDRAGHDWRYAIDYSKINKEFGWKPRMKFDVGLVDTIEWYQANESWWKPLKEQSSGKVKPRR